MSHAPSRRFSAEGTTVQALLDARLDSDPDSLYMDVTGTTFTAGQVAEQGWRISSSLASLGVRAGDRIASILENSPEALLLWFGIVAGGGVGVPINTAYKGDYLVHQVGDSAASVLVVQIDLADRVIAVVDRLTSVRHVVLVGSEDAAETTAGLLAAAPTITVHTWADLLAGEPVRPSVTIKPSDLGTFIYTGGTTGPSKGCMLSHNYHEALARQIGICWRRTADDVVWTPLPLFHFNALVTVVLGALVYGGRGAIYSKFSVSNFWPEMNRTGATIVSLLGSLAYLLAEADAVPAMPGSGDPTANESLRLMAAAPLPPELDRRIRERFGLSTFSGAFGLTESSLIAWQPHGVENKPGGAGVVNRDYFDVKIFDDNDQEVEVDTPGEIVVRPLMPNVMFEGYWGRPEATVAAWRNLWFHTGDIGRIDDDDFLFFVDRKADYLRRRGENISSFEVEGVFLRHEAVVEAVVCAVPSEITEDDLKLTLVLAPGVETPPTEAELFVWCVDQLPYFALPRYIELVDDLPRSPVGRVLKREVRAAGITPTTWDLEQSDISYEKR